MVAAPADRIRALAILLSCIAGIGVLCSLAAALRWAPVAGISARGDRITWVAPDGAAWSAGIRPGDTLLVDARRPHLRILVRTQHGQRALVSASSVTPTLADTLVAALGLCVLLLGGLVIGKAEERRASLAFWLMCLVGGIAAGLLPATVHGFLWAIAAQFIALKLFGPSLLWLALSFPNEAAKGVPRWPLIVPPLLVLAMYPFAWLRPAEIFPIVYVVSLALLATYLLAAAARLIYSSSRPSGRSDVQRAQLTLLRFGLLAGLGPFTLLTVLPQIAVGRALVPAEISILSMVLLPASIGVAIVREEFLGITSLLHRQTLHMLVRLVFLLGTAAIAWLVVEDGADRWSWPASVSAAAACGIALLLVVPLQRRVTRRVEYLLLRDAYDMAATLLKMSVELSLAKPEEIGRIVVTYLTTVLDLSFAHLRTDSDQWYHAHPRSSIPDDQRRAIDARTRELFADLPHVESLQDQARHLPILVVPVWRRRTPDERAPAIAGLPYAAAPDPGAEWQPLALLTLGPKRSGDRYTEQDRVLLGTLSRHLAAILHNHALLARLDEQIIMLRSLIAERKTLTERVQSAAEQERHRLASILHDDAIQLGGEMVRSLRDTMALRGLPPACPPRLAATAELGESLLSRLRQVVADLYPPPLATGGLIPAIQDLLRATERTTGVACHLEIDPRLRGRRFDRQQEDALYSMVREMVRNTVRHAQASELRVALTYEGEQLRVLVRDDGEGFVLPPIADLLNAGHLGLALLHDRAQELGGSLQICTAPGEGTRIDVRLPIPASAAVELRDVVPV